MDSLPKFTGLIRLNATGIAGDNISFQFLTSSLVPEIFVIKVGNCVKSFQILHVFGRPNFFGEGPRNYWTCNKKLSHILITWQSFVAIGRGSSEILWLIKKINKTRNMGQSPTWGRQAAMSDVKYISRSCKVCTNLRGQHPAPHVWPEIHFREL